MFHLFYFLIIMQIIFLSLVRALLPSTSNPTISSFRNVNQLINGYIGQVSHTWSSLNKRWSDVHGENSVLEITVLFSINDTGYKMYIT